MYKVQVHPGRLKGSVMKCDLVFCIGSDAHFNLKYSMNTDNPVFRHCSVVILKKTNVILAVGQ